MAEGIHIDLGELGRQLKDVDKTFATAVRKRVRTAVQTAGTELVGKVRSEASWSRRIPRSTKLTVSFSARRSGVTVRTGSKQAPHARPLEFGSKGNPGFNRHGVFGRTTTSGVKVWVNQPVRPYFFPVVERSTPGIDASFQEAIDRAVREAGFI